MPIVSSLGRRIGSSSIFFSYTAKLKTRLKHKNKNYNNDKKINKSMGYVPNRRPRTTGVPKTIKK